jgi:hypothetical protein
MSSALASRERTPLARRPSPERGVLELRERLRVLLMLALYRAGR